MNNQNDPLSNLWQSQPVQNIDIQELKSLWKKNRRKQWLWALSDIIGLVAGVFMIAYFLQTEDNLFRQIWLGVFLVLIIVVTPWSLRLRVASLRSNVPTSEYLSRLIQQKINNICIARMCIWMGIFVALFFSVWSIAYYYYYQPVPSEYLIKVLKGTGLVVVMSVLMGWWARYEINKNSKLLKRYQSLKDEC